MEEQKLIQALHTAEKLKDTMRHCYTSGGRRESVGEHSWRTALMAYWIADEFPEADMNKVIKMCLIHDLGECFTGDIPTFDKTKADEEREEQLLYAWLETLPSPYCTEMRALFEEMAQRETVEAKIFKALDNMEAVIQHNESDIATWSDNEYELNLTYGGDKVTFSEYLSRLREALRDETIQKIKGAAAGNLLSGGEGAHYRAAFATKDGVAPESSDYRGNNDKYSASWGKSGADNRALGTENLLYSRSRGKSD